MICATRRKLRELGRSTLGVSTVELALILPIILIGIGSLANLTQQISVKNQLHSAVSAGARKVVKDGALDANAVKTLVEGYTSLPGVSASPAPSVTCLCLGSTGTRKAISCTSTCTNGDLRQSFAVVNATVTFKPQLTLLSSSNVTMTETVYSRMQ